MVVFWLLILKSIRTISNPADLIDSVVGGNRYGWFATNDFEGLAIDNTKKTNFDDVDEAVPEFGVLAAIGILGAAGLFLWKRRN